MLLETNLPKGVENFKLQIDIFAFETNKQTNKNKTQTKKEWNHGLFHLFSRSVCVNGFYFVQNKTGVIALNLEISVSARCKIVCAIVKSAPYQETLWGTKKRKYRTMSYRKQMHLTIIPWSRVGYEMVNIINLVSNEGERNNCFSKFSTSRFAKFSLSLRNNLKLMWLPGAKYHDHMIRALPCKQLNEKSKGKQITGKLRIHGLFCTGKNLTAMFSSVQSLNSSGSVIIMDIYTVGAKILGKALLIAMWNWRCTGWEIIFDKNSFPGLLRWKLVWDCCWISFSFPCTEVALPEDAFRRSHDWEHVTVGFNSLIGLVCRYGLDLPRLTVIGREHCDKCSSEAAVCEMWLYAGSLWHLFHHAIECSCAKRCVAKPDFVVGGIELLALAIYWSQDIWRWVEMVPSSSWALLLNTFQIPERKISSRLIHLQHQRGRPGDFL